MKSSPRENYLCYRCGAIGKHFSNDCFAKNRICHQCGKTGHMARICQQSKKIQHPQRSVHQLSSCCPHSDAIKEPHTTDAAVHSLQNVHGRKRASFPHSSLIGFCAAAPHHTSAQPRRQLSGSQHCSYDSGRRCSPSRDQPTIASVNNNFDDSFLG